MSLEERLNLLLAMPACNLALTATVSVLLFK
jgi:hypothetical protein